MADTTREPAPVQSGGNPGGGSAPEGGAGDVTDPIAPAASAKTDEVKPEVRRRWEAQAAKAERARVLQEISQRLGGEDLEEILTERQAAKAERERLAEQSATEAQRAAKKHAAIEAERNTLKSQLDAAAAELREHRLERPLRDLAASVKVKEPHYAGVILAALKERATLAEDGKSVLAIGDDGQPDPDLKLDKVLSEVVARYRDLVTTPLQGHGSGPTHPAGTAPTGNAGATNGGRKLTREQERDIYAGFLPKRT